MTTAARIDELRKKFDENPRRYFAPLANELRKAGELSQAIALCREHLPKQPGHMSGYIVFGQALYEGGELSEARGVFEQALALDPENLIALRHLGDIARRQGDAVLARRWYERVLDADPRNDDIAAQLATLGTPVPPMAVVAPPAAPVSTAAPTPAYAVPPIMLSAVPTPDAAMRAVDIGAIPLRPPEPPPLLDLDALEAVGERSASSSEPVVDAARDTADGAAGEGVSAAEDGASHASVDPAVHEPVEATVEEGGEAAHEDDPFAFAEVSSPGARDVAADDTIDVEAAFEEGLAAPEWPDTAALAARIGTPRTVTPVSVPLSPDAVEAFGREPQDALSHPPAATASPSQSGPTHEAHLEAAVPHPAESGDQEEASAASDPDSRVPEHVELVEEEAFVTAEAFVAAPTSGEFATRAEANAVDAPLAEAEREPDAVTDEGNASTIDALAESEVSLPPMVSAAEELADMVTAASDDDDLPWLAPADENDGIADAVAIADALEGDARASGEADHVAVSDISDVDASPIEASFADVLPSDDDDDAASPDATRPDAEPSPAFVTETMAELLVAQGLTAQAVSVYEELVRRRPYDPMLSSRLAELQESLAPAAASVSAPAEPQFTARERFARLAARRVSRRTPVTAGVAVDGVADDSLSALFGSEPMPVDDAAARTLAAAFAPLPEASPVDAGSSLFSRTPAAGSVRQPTPMRPMTPVRSATPLGAPAVSSAGDFSFDRFFPDPAAAGTEPAADRAGGDPARSQGAPSAGDDLAQFSAWLKGLGNT